MNLVFVFIFILLLVVVFILSEKFQELVIESFGLAADSIGPHVPEILETGRRVALVLMVALGALWVISFLGFWIVGALTNSAWEGFLLGILVPLWSARYIFRKITSRSKPKKAETSADTANTVKVAKASSLGFSGVLVVLFLIPFGIGLWSPVYKASLNRSAENKKQNLANWLNKGSMISEPESGIKAEIIQETVTYDENSMEFPNYTARKGLQVEVVNLDNDVHNMYLVRFPNKHGDITARSSVAYVPREKVTILNR